jgi:hypothetical protein
MSLAVFASSSWSSASFRDGIAQFHAFYNLSMYGSTVHIKRYLRLTILTSQLLVSKWHEQIDDPTLADGILDRLVHNAHGIEMRGDSIRKNRGKSNA